MALIASLFAVAAAVNVIAEPSQAPPVPDPQDLIDLVRSTVLAVDAANKSGDYGGVHAIGTPAFQAALPPDQLSLVFSDLRAANVDMAEAGQRSPLTTRPPTLDRQGLLRILGFFEFSERQLVYDLLYDYDFDDARWRLAGIKLTPRDLPQTPELMQPQ
jgi:hypothetical protein